MADGNAHLAPPQSPLSIYSRVKAACHALQSECEKLDRMRQANLQGSVELYWLAKSMSLDTEEMWRILELNELKERERLLAEVASKFMSLLPRTVVAAFAQNHKSPGQLAVALSEAQGRNADSVLRSIEVEVQIEKSRARLQTSDAALANAESLYHLTAFETQLLNSEKGGTVRPQTQRTTFPLGGFPYLQSLQKSFAENTQKAEEIEDDCGRLKQLLARAIDLGERNPGCFEEQSLYGQCKDITAKYQHIDASLFAPPKC